MLKSLRIAVTTLSLTACVLLIALWVRSYWWADRCTLASHLELSSFYGRLGFYVLLSPYYLKCDWCYSCVSAAEWFGYSGMSRMQFAIGNLATFATQSKSPA
jgi:hypothetical protein